MLYSPCRVGKPRGIASTSMTEIREYWRILRARWYLPVLLTVLTVALSFFTAQTPPPTYVASTRFTISVSADRPLQGVDPALTGAQASEYIRDDFVEVIRSDLFAKDVNAVLNDPQLKIGKGNISGAVEKQRRIMSLSITWNNPEQAKRIADAAVQALATHNAKYFAQMGAQGATVTILDDPTVSAITPGLRERLDIVIRAALAFFAGIVLVFILDYLDDSVRTGRDLEKMGWRVLGEITDKK